MKKYLATLAIVLGCFLLPQLSRASTYTIICGTGSLQCVAGQNPIPAGDYTFDASPFTSSDYPNNFVGYHYPSGVTQNFGITYTGSGNIFTLHVPEDMYNSVNSYWNANSPYMPTNDCNGIGYSGYCHITLTPVPTGPTITFVSPSSTATVADFYAWHLSLSNLSSTLDYTIRVYYSSYGSSQTFYDQQFWYHGEGTGGDAYIGKSVALAAYGTSTTWYAYTELWEGLDSLGEGTLVATTSPILFDVNEATSLQGTWTIPVQATTSIASFLMSTSTCSGWSDVSCEIGNVFANGINFIFGINPSEINAVAGFNMATQKPFSFITDIQTTIANVNTSGTSLASSTISMNLTGTSTSVTWFSQAQATRFLGSAFIAFVRSLAYAALLLIAVFGFYLEIRKIFVKPHQN